MKHFLAHYCPLLVAISFLATVLLVAGCTETVEPGGDDPADGIGRFEGQVDPGTESVLLKTLQVEGGGGVPVRVQLIGRFVRVGTPEGAIGLSVAVRNLDTRPLYAPAELALSGFRPPSVYPDFDLADWVICPAIVEGDTTAVERAESCVFGFGYSRLLGDDGILSPEETSGERLMVFINPESVSFSFNVEVSFGMEPDRPRIAGTFYSDLNRNGVRDRDEPPFGGGSVRVDGPGIAGMTVAVDADGRYSVRVSEPGLYNVWATPPPTFAPVEPTTSNPLEVVLLPGPDGAPQSFLHADFGWANSPLIRPVWLIDDTDSLALDPYTLLRMDLDHRVLRLHIGFSGCSPDHPLQLYMVGPFMESFPVQVRLLLDHDDRGELCDAWFEQRLAFDLQPIVDEYEEAYGRVDPIILNFEDADGTVHRLEMQP